MLQGAQHVLEQDLNKLLHQLSQISQQNQHLAMLSRTHGQSASPTTVGKEIKNIMARLELAIQHWLNCPIYGKFNGAVGNFNAHVSAFPTLNWPQISQKFVESFKLTYNPLTTQIEPHDGLATWLFALCRINTILIDTARDAWQYISLGYFKQKVLAGEVGSSTMPHKVNPIDFENAEGNLGIANALATHLAHKLPISRLQRDLSDSTVLRNLGTVCGHSLLSFHALSRGLNKININPTPIQNDLEQNWAVLAEAIQTVLRKHQHHDAYEQLKQFTQGQDITETSIKDFIKQCDLPKETKHQLSQLTPQNYTGLAGQLCDMNKKNKKEEVA